MDRAAYRKWLTFFAISPAFFRRAGEEAATRAPDFFVVSERALTMLSNAVPEGVWKDTIRANTDELRSAAVVAAFVPENKKQATLTRQTLANRNPAASR